MHRTATRFGLIVTVAVLAASKVAAQEAPSAAGPHLQPNAGGEAAAVKRVVDGIMQPYLAQGQRRPRWPHMEPISLSGNDRRGFAARPSLLLPVWKGYRRGRSVHARHPSGDRLLHQDVHHHAVRAGYQPQPNRP